MTHAKNTQTTLAYGLNLVAYDTVSKVHVVGQCVGQSQPGPLTQTVLCDLPRSSYVK